MSTLSILPNTDSTPPNTITLHSANKEVLRITHDGRMICGEGLSADEATQEAAKLLIASFEEQIQMMVGARVARRDEGGQQMITPTPPPWIAEGYDLRQKHGRMIAYFGPHHPPADEYPLSCRLQDEANAQWVATARNELAAERERVRVLRDALENLRDEQNGAPLCTRETEWKDAMDKADAALAATKEEGSK